MPIMDRLRLEVFGKRLRRRKDQQMSQQQLAALMQVPQSWISELENGKQPMSKPIRSTASAVPWVAPVTIS